MSNESIEAIKKQIGLKEYKDKLVIVHYSCSDINDKSPTISPISTYDTKLKLLKTFSRENNTKEDEISTLEEFCISIISKAFTFFNEILDIIIEEKNKQLKNEKTN